MTRHSSIYDAAGQRGAANLNRVERTVTADQLRTAIEKAKPGTTVTVEQTGGGCATLYLGEYDPDGRAWLVVGPGSFDWYEPWHSTFWLNDLALGPDDDGETEPKFPTSVDEVARLVAEWA